MVKNWKIKNYCINFESKHIKIINCTHKFIVKTLNNYELKISELQFKNNKQEKQIEELKKDLTSVIKMYNKCIEENEILNNIIKGRKKNEI